MSILKKIEVNLSTATQNTEKHELLNNKPNRVKLMLYARNSYSDNTAANIKNLKIRTTPPPKNKVNRDKKTIA